MNSNSNSNSNSNEGIKSALKQKPQQKQNKQTSLEEVVERPELPYLFEKELIEKQNQCIHKLHETFIPARHTHIVDRKFYAHHDFKLPYFEKFLDYTAPKQTERRGIDGHFPRLESQVYGWSPRHLTAEYLRQLNYISGPKLRCDMTIFGEQLNSNRITERPEFNGVRFFLQ